MKQQSPDVEQNTTSEHSRLHRPLPHSHLPNRADAAQGLACCLHWSSAGKKGSQRCGCQQEAHSSLAARSSRVTTGLAKAVASTVNGAEGIRSPKTQGLFFHHHTDKKNQIFIFCLEAIQVSFFTSVLLH